ncbi:MAG: fumarate hydratase [Planctomycetota bacterium]
MKDDLCDIVMRAAADLYVHALKKIPPDVREAIATAQEKETNSLAREILSTILRNIQVAEEMDNIICQDTGTPVYLLRMGDGFPLRPSQVVEAIRRGCDDATRNHNLRPNILHPLRREHTNTNVGRHIPVIHFDFVADDETLEVMMVPKGSGSENQSFLKMLVPAEGIAGVRRFVLESVVAAGANPCPPTVVGVGIGGTFDLCPILAKKAIARPVGSRNRDPEIAKLEEDLLMDINQLGIGPMGLGGDTTALDVHIETADTHISQLPVAVNCQCWAARRAGARISAEGEAAPIDALGKEG